MSKKRCEKGGESIPSIGETAARCPVQLERTIGVGNYRAIEIQSLGGSLRALEVNETVAGIAGEDQYALADVWKTGMTGLPGEFVTNHLHIDLLTQIVPDCAHEVLVDPRFKFAHPVLLSALAARELISSIAR